MAYLGKTQGFDDMKALSGFIEYLTIFQTQPGEQWPNMQRLELCRYIKEQFSLHFRTIGINAKIDGKRQKMAFRLYLGVFA